MTDQRIEKVVIVGGGTAGWMAAALLARTLPGQFRIELIESDEIGIVGVGEATIPQIRLFNDILGLDEADFLRKTQGTYKLGIQFNDWGRLGDAYLHAFGGIGISLGMLDFYHYWLSRRMAGTADDLWDYSLNATAAMAERFSHLDKVGDTRMQGLAYAYHFDASLFARCLRGYSEPLGVVRTEGRIVETTLREHDGFIESVTLQDGTRIAGDLFIDCSGFRGLLIEQALHSGYEDWTHWLPCDRAVAVPSRSVERMRPYTQATARAAGWQWRIPLQHRTGNGYVYSSRHVSDDEATAALLDKLEGEALAEPRLLRFVTGMRTRAWHKNCVALGLASGFMEPLESTSIHLIQFGLGRLVSLFPDKRFAQQDIDEYNRHVRFEYERIRDFLILHYHANERTDSAFWTQCREMSVPPELTRKMDLYRSAGRIYRDGEELFTPVGWLQVMHGQRLTPQAYHPQVDLFTPTQLDEFLANVKKIVANAVAPLPGHREFVARFCATAPARP